MLIRSKTLIRPGLKPLGVQADENHPRVPQVYYIYVCSSI